MVHTPTLSLTMTKPVKTTFNDERTEVSPPITKTFEYRRLELEEAQKKLKELKNEQNTRESMEPDQLRSTLYSQLSCN
jgi:uncharacterized membrane protein YjjP (DUF1212 family)